jgi:hypothetical protein
MEPSYHNKVRQDLQHNLQREYFDFMISLAFENIIAKLKLLFGKTWT